MSSNIQARFSSHSRTVSNRIAVFALDAAQRAGLSPQLFTERTGISAHDLVDINGRIDGARHRRLVELMALLGYSACVNGDGPPALFPDFPVLGNLCLNGRTLREAIESFHTFRALIGEFDFLCYKETPAFAQFEYIAEFAPGNCFQALANFQILATLIRAYDTARRTVFQVALMGRPPSRSRDASEFFGSEVRYDAEANRLQFDSTLLDAPFPQYNGTLAPYLLQQAQQELLRIRRGHLFSANVESLISDIIRNPDDEDPTSSSILGQICERLNTSRWTLRRQLQAEGLHFTELEARVKLREACRLLSETRLSVAHISEQLGFSSQSAFTRFFRSRNDMPPLAFRQRAQWR